MSSGPVKPGISSKGRPGSFGSVPPNTQNILLDKLSVRTSTPDSEALASSEDEGDSQRLHHSHHSHAAAVATQAQHHGQARRPSWFADQGSTIGYQHQASFASASMSPTASHPTTPSGEGGAAWGPAPPVLNKSATTNSFTWGGQGIWNPERRDPRSRMADAIPSPTSTIPPGNSSNSFFGSDATLTQPSPDPRDISNTGHQHTFPNFWRASNQTSPITVILCRAV